MLVFILALMMVVLAGINAKGQNEFYTDYCSPKNTSTANAVFSVLIFISHSVTYVDLNGTLDDAYLSVKTFLAQSVVVTYLFYSGFGIMESIKKKGYNYVKRMPFDRFFKLWYQFAFMLCLFIISNILMKKEYSVTRILLSFTGYESISNDNWYLFVTFALYIIVFISFILCKKHHFVGVIGVFALTIAFIILEIKLEFPRRYFDTILCFPLGMLFSHVKPVIDKIVMKNDITWILTTTAVFVICMYGSQNRDESLLFRMMFMCTAPVFITLLMMKLQCRSTILDWFGNHIFSFFMLQRIPMRMLDYLGFDKSPYLFICLAFFGTVVLSTIVDEIFARLDKIIFKKRVKV